MAFAGNSRRRGGRGGFFSSSNIKETLGLWEKHADFIQNPEKIATMCATASFKDTCLTDCRNILQGRMKQTSMDRLFF